VRPVVSSHARLAFLAAAALALAGSCRSAPAGPPVPDAESIINGSAGPGVRVDSIDAPFVVALERGRWQAREERGRAIDFWGAIGRLDLARAERAATTVDERTFAVALRTLMGGDPDAAAVAFGVLHRTATDLLVRTRSRVGLTMSLTWSSDWASIAAMETNQDSAGLDSDPRVAQATVERWARAFAGLPPVSITLPPVPMTVPLRRSVFGTPVVTVVVNGRPHEFWLDTGSSMTLVSAEVAIESGIRLASPDTLALGVVTGHIEARAVYVDSLAIGGFVAHGLTAAVVNREVLRLDRSVVNGVTRSIPIDGVIGADLIRHMDLVIDARAGTLTIRQPRKGGHATRNLFWVGYPVVRLVSHDGQPLLFGLDTGAEGSFVTSTLLRKLPRTPIAARRGKISGLGTETTLTEWVAREIRLSDGDYAIALRNTPVAPARRWTFVDFDGIIGSDVALGTRLHLDFTNGVFDVRPSEAVEKGVTVTVSP
jgi:predicted aspartyl protease